MNNKEFDQLIKNSLEGLSEVPSGNLGKTLGRKMFFNNIWIFHKKKVLILFLFLGATTLFLWDSEEELNNDLITNNIESIESKTFNNVNNLNKSITLKTAESNLNKKSKNSTIKKIKYNSIKKNNINVSNKSTLISIKNKTDKKLITKSSTKQNGINKSSFINKTFPNKDSEALSLNITSKKLASNHEKEIDLIERKKAKYINLDTEKNIINFEAQDNLIDDYAIERKGDFSIDAYITPYNQTKISNRLNNNYAKNWWDFYKENKYVSSKLEAGIRVNYDWKNIIISSGIKYEKIIEYTPKYIYEKTDDELLLSSLGISEVSGVQINGVDSAHYVFYVEQDEELIASIDENYYNRYSYVSIPVKLGYEFEASKFSIIVQGGIVYNQLVGVKGNYLRRYQNKENIDVYYNQGIEVASLSRNNSMLKSSYISFIGSVSGNAKISPSFDLFGEFTCSKSQNSITKDNYFNDKKLTNFGTNFGVKYYLQPRLKYKDTEQQLF